MMRDKKSQSATAQGGDEINMSPLIDMVFILLIFFIVTTVFVQEPGVEIARPFAINAKDLEKNCILLAVTSQGEIYYGGESVGLGGVRSIVRRLVEENERYPVIIQADENARGGLVVQLIDEVKLAQAERIYVSTTN